MHKDSSHLKTPEGDATLWRYMDFAKYVSLIQISQLHFTKVGDLDAVGEGLYTSGDIALVNEAYPVGDEGRIKAKMRDFEKMAQEEFFVNCWHKANYESPGMWARYTDDKYGVAIKTRYEALCDAFRDNDDSIYSCELIYIEDNQSSLQQNDGSLLPFMFNRIEFEEEREVRFFCRSRNNSPEGEFSQVNLSTFANEIVVSPFAAKWFVDLVRTIASTRNLDERVRESSLRILPRV